MCGKSYTQGLSNETIVDRFPPTNIFVASRFLHRDFCNPLAPISLAGPYGRSEGFPRAAYFVPGRDGIGVWPISEIASTAVLSGLDPSKKDPHRISAQEGVLNSTQSLFWATMVTFCLCVFEVLAKDAGGGGGTIFEIGQTPIPSRPRTK